MGPMACDGIVVRERRYDDFYKRLRGRLAAWLGTSAGRRYRFARYLMLVPDLFHLMVRLLFDRRVPGKEKAVLAAVIGFVISPVDFLPEAFLGPVGFTDDLVLMALVVQRLLKNVPEEVLLSHWSGDQDLLATVQTIVGLTEQMVGGKISNQLKRWMTVVRGRDS